MNFFSPNFILSILFNNIFTLISENVFWVEDSPAPAMGALYSIINEIVVHVKKKKKKKKPEWRVLHPSWI